MAEIKRGAKAGVVAGLIYGILSGIAGLIYLIVMKDDVISKISASLPSNVPITAEQVYPLALGMSIPSSVIWGLIFGAIFGIFFAVIHEEWIGKNSRIKGLTLTLVILVLLAIGDILAPGNAAAGIFLIQMNWLPAAVLTSIFFLVFGYLLGMFFDRFGRIKKKS
jgi:hypothetical protein